MKLSVEGLSFAYGRKQVLRGLDLPSIDSGQLTAVLGPNAVGKSTFFRCLAGLQRPSGRVLVTGDHARDSRVVQSADLRQLVTYLPQDHSSSAVLTVFEAVLVARQRRASWAVADADLQRVSLALAELGIEDLALRHLNELSGGQRQLVSMAQVLVRDAPILLLDEPTSNLDLQRQLEVLQLLRRLAVERGRTVVVALHDLNLAARFADRIVVLHDGAIQATGSPSAVLTVDLLQSVYGVVARVWSDEDGVPHIVPLASARDSILRSD
jgi:iron complex transport system ATP-binding protein